MTHLSASLRMAPAAAAAFLAAAVACGAQAAGSAAPSASPAVGPTASSRMTSKCAAMSGDEKSACERDIRADAQAHPAHSHSKKAHAKPASHAASATS